MSRSLRADLILLFVTLCWGVTFPLIENAVRQVNPFIFVSARFFVAIVILVPFVMRSWPAKVGRALISSAMVLGILNIVGYTTQTIGMQTLGAAEGAFIMGVSVIIVPFVAPLFGVGSFKKKDLACSLLCLLGLYILTGANLSHINIGELWLLVCAVAAAFAIVYLQKASMQSNELMLLAFLQILFTGLFSIPMAIGKSTHHLFSVPAMIGILFCAIFATSIALLLQTKFQRDTTAPRAAMIYCLEPIFASIFGYLINGETMGWKMLLGAAIILMSIVISELYLPVPAITRDLEPNY